MGRNVAGCGERAPRSRWALAHAERHPDLSGSDDADRLQIRWAGRVLALLRRVDGLRRRLARADSLEQRLDDALNELAAWIPGEFKQPAPGWKHSSVGFRGVVEGVQQYALFFYVDDIELEHLFRQSRVEGQVRREVMRRLPQAGLRAGTPRRDVRLVDGNSAGIEPRAGVEAGGA